QLVIPVEVFFNNDLEYLTSQNKERTYSLLITKALAVRYTMEGIEDMILTLWSLVIQDFDMDSALGIQHWRPQRQHFHRAKIQVEKKQGYGHLKEIVVRRADQYLYKLKEGDFSDLYLNDIEDMLLLISQNKLSKLDSDVIVDFVTALKPFTQGIVLKNKVKDI
nr:hypothetical protein [Tanacetum cinerariifolium]